MNTVDMEKYTTGTGQTVWVHTKENCKGTHCVIHNPSEHPMKDFPTHWRSDRGIMERICPHGVGHPDPDGLAFLATVLSPERLRIERIHGCDGCCVPKGDSEQ